MKTTTPIVTPDASPDASPSQSGRTHGDTLPGRAPIDPRPIDPRVRVGHVNLRVGNLAQATAFYVDVLGFAVTMDGRPAGVPLVGLAAGDYHHHIALNTFQSAGGTPPPTGHSGLHHVALLYPDRPALGAAVGRILAYGHPLDGAEDHGGTVSVYLHDLDGNGLELYYDQPPTAWYDAAGRPVFQAEPFDPRELLEQGHHGTAMAAVTVA